MGAGFIALLFNPQAWIVLAVATALSFSGGVVKGWNWSNAEHWHQQAIALEAASKQKDELLRADADRAEADRIELARLEESLDAIIHAPPAPEPAPVIAPPGTVPPPPAPAFCKLSVRELGQLRDLAAGNGKRLR